MKEIFLDGMWRVATAMRGRFISIASVLSLLLCLTMMILWWRGRWWVPEPPAYWIGETMIWVERGELRFWHLFRPHFEFQIDCWKLVGLFAFLPTVRFFVVRIKQRTSPGHCPQCSYDLTGNTSGICPECGTKIASR